MRPLVALDETAVHVVGVALVVLCMVATLVSQSAKGDAWRGDVDPEARTELVTTGPFRCVRNPIFTATATTAFGLALLVPNALALGMLVAFLASLQIQVRLVEEPTCGASTGIRTSGMPRGPDAFCPGSVGVSRPRSQISLSRILGS